MMKNDVSIMIPPAVLAEAQGHLSAALTLLQPFLLALTPEDRHRILKMSDKSVAFVSKTLQYAESSPEYAPPYLKISNLQVDVEAVQQLTSLEQPAESLIMQLNDTIMAAGSEAFSAALMYYNSVKRASEENVPGAKAIYEDLKVRFEVNRKK
ncbi:MAG: hypothetical protein ACOH2A_09265 [Sphingobacteriaceae bacterium]